MEKSEHRIVTLLPLSLHKTIKRLAKRNGRSLSGEVRFALQTYVESSGATAE